MRYYINLCLTSSLFLLLISCGDASSPMSKAGYLRNEEQTGDAGKAVNAQGFYKDQTEISNNDYARYADSISTGGTQNAPPPPPNSPEDISLKAQVKNPDMIIKTGSLDIAVEDFSKSMSAISALVKSHNGYIQNENESSDNWAKRNSLVIRVPAAGFEKLMSSIGGIAKTVINRQVNTSDVSEEYYDTDARKKSQQAAANRYIELLKQAKNVEEIMAVQSRIDIIQEEIDSKEGRMRYLRDQVGYSTISLSVAQNYDYKPADGPDFSSRMGNAFGSGWQGFLNFLLIVVNLWPLWLISGLLFWIIRRIVKRFRTKKQA